jgi:hypothetical protein
MNQLHEAVGGWMESCRAGQMDDAHGGQGLEQLKFELPALVGGGVCGHL